MESRRHARRLLAVALCALLMGGLLLAAPSVQAVQERYETVYLISDFSNSDKLGLSDAAKVSLSEDRCVTEPYSLNRLRRPWSP